MIITGMDHFQSVCKKKLVEWYQKNRPETPIDLEVYDMLSSMVMDSDFAEERKEIQRQIKKLAEM